MGDCFGFYSLDFGVDITSILLMKFLEKKFEQLEENSKKKKVVFIRAIFLALGIIIDVIIAKVYLE